MNFKFDVAVVFKDKKPLPPLNYFYHLFMENGKIPISVIKDINHPLWKILSKDKEVPDGYKPEYIILTIEYNKNFEA